MKLFIATPMYGGNCTGNYTNSLLQLSNTLLANNINWKNKFAFNESLITRARNYLTHEFLKSDCTHLLFIDADIEFNSNDVISMLKADKDIICGAYPKKTINWNYIAEASKNNIPANRLQEFSGEFVLHLLDGQNEIEVEADKPFEVLNSGTGFMMIKREVFDKIKVPSYNFHGEQNKEYFTTAIVNNDLLSEDYYFCKLARDIGYKIYIAPWVKLSHVGTYAFTGSLFQQV